MRVLLLGAANSIHVQRWSAALAARGILVCLATQHPPEGWDIPAGVSLHLLRFRGSTGYFLNAWGLRRLAKRTRPDLVNAHYASGYGTTAALVGYSPTLLSVWGSDVYLFPYKSALAGWLVRRNLRRSSRVASTSHAMASQVRSLLPTVGAIEITPFGVDTARFQRPAARTNPGDITIGTVKSLAPVYGIDVLIRAFAALTRDTEVRSKIGSAGLRLLIVGDGPQRAELEQLAAKLGVSERTEFAGRVPHDQVPRWLAQLDVYVAPSRSESFGVAVIEASAAGVPVVVSAVGGLPEVVQGGTTGLIVPPDDEEALCRALKELTLQPEVRRRMGQAGVAFVAENYEWSKCVDTMIAAYERTIAAARRS